jgi:hypothetical protein
MGLGVKNISIYKSDIEFWVLTKVVMKSFNFWDITPYSPLKVNRSFGGTYRFNLQVRRINQARNHCEAGL